MAVSPGRSNKDRTAIGRASNDAGKKSSTSRKSKWSYVRDKWGGLAEGSGGTSRKPTMVATPKRPVSSVTSRPAYAPQGLSSWGPQNNLGVMPAENQLRVGNATPIVGMPTGAVGASGSPQTQVNTENSMSSLGGNTGGATGSDIMAPLTGAVGGYGIRPDMIPLLYQEPQALLRMTMANMGMSANQNPGMYQAALPGADLVNALMMIGTGGKKIDAGGGDNSETLNWMDNFFRQGLTKGGDSTNFNAGMQNILGAGVDTPLGSMLQNEDPRGQYQQLASLMLPLAESGLHPLFARSLQKSMEALRDEYFSRYANGTPPTSMAQGMASRLGLG